MKIIDITQELLSCAVWPGDPSPRREVLSSIQDGGSCNLSALSMCVHNGTHIDAPYHFIDGGKTVDRIPAEVFAGECFVARCEGALGAQEATDVLSRAGGVPRILIAGKAVVTEQAAAVFAGAGLFLIGNESQTVGPENAPKKVHEILLGAGVVLLEGVVLEGVPEGRYFLSAAPLNIAGSEGSPCRALLFSGL